MFRVKFLVAAEIMMIFVAGGCKPERPTITLHKAASKGNIEQLKSHFYWGCDVNKKDDNGYTPLHKASDAGQLEAARLLIEKGADVDARITNSIMGLTDSFTPIFLAVYRAYPRVLKLLIEHGANVNAKNSEGSTPLHMAVYYTIHKDEGISLENRAIVLEALLKHGAKPNVWDKGYKGYAESKTPLHVAAGLGHGKFASLLIEHGADVNAIEMGSTGPRTPLDIAIANERKKAADILRKHGGVKSKTEEYAQEKETLEGIKSEKAGIKGKLSRVRPIPVMEDNDIVKNSADIISLQKEEGSAPPDSSKMGFNLGRPIVMGTLSKEQILRVIRKKNKQIGKCTDGRKGKVSVKFTISSKGNVNNAIVMVDVRKTTIHSDIVERCIASTFRGMIFPNPPGSGIVMVYIPIIFNR